jgi:hypothetical protein
MGMWALGVSSTLAFVEQEVNGYMKLNDSGGHPRNSTK